MVLKIAKSILSGEIKMKKKTKKKPYTRQDVLNHKKNSNVLRELLIIQKKFFPALHEMLNKVTDNRHQSYVKYSPLLILFVLLMKQAANLGTMRAISTEFTEQAVIDNVNASLGLSGDKKLQMIPHYDTINNFLKKLNPEEIEAVRLYMVRQILATKSFGRYRLLANPNAPDPMKKYFWKVSVDATQIHVFKEEPYPGALKKVHKNKEAGTTVTRYYCQVLEAKLVIGDEVISLGTEFIENEEINASKQDCESKAFHRLCARLKKQFPRLPVCILGDSLYSCGPVMDACREHGWRFIFRFKEGRIPSVSDKFEEVLENGGFEHLGEVTGIREAGIYWLNGITYQEKKVNIIDLQICRGELATENEWVKSFLYLTDIKVDKSNAEEIVSGGRSRWKIENQGFKRQKKELYYIEHLNCHHPFAVKNHYLMTQMTDILMTLLRLMEEVKTGIKKSAAKKSSELLGRFTRLTLTAEDLIIIKETKNIHFHRE